MARGNALTPSSTSIRRFVAHPNGKSQPAAIVA